MWFNLVLPKEYRLPLRKELNNLKKKGKIFQGQLFGLLVGLGDKDKNSSFGFIISNKIHKRANKRNRARRLLGEVIYSFLPQIKKGYAGVFLAKKGIIEADFEKVKKEMKLLLEKAHLLND